jgi:tetratricopeptide (TPR) repeat protein
MLDTRSVAGRVLVAAVLLAVVGGTAWSGEKDKKSPGEEALRQKALALNDITGALPLDGKLQELADDPAGTKKLLTVATRMAKGKQQPFNRNATLLLAVAAEHLKEVDTSALFYRLNAVQSLKLLSERSLAQAYVGLILMYADNKRFADSEKVCKEFLALDGGEDEAIERLKPLVKRRMILSIAKQGSTQKALEMIGLLQKEDPTSWRTLALKAEVLKGADKLEDAAKAYLDTIARVKKDGDLEKDEKAELIADYRYVLSGLYVDADKVDRAAEQLKLLLAVEPDNPTYLNDLGYIWADRGMNLAESEKLIRRAIEEERKLRKKAGLKGDDDKDNAAYLDSLGWVLFKQGKAKEAKPHLLQAVKDKEGQHTEILDHLAEIHMALGEKTEAIAVWKKAAEAATDSKRDQKRKAEVLKKLKAKE